MKIVFALLTGSLLGSDPRVEFAIGVREKGAGNEEAALVCFEKALALEPGALPLVDRVAGYRLAAGDRAGAVKLFRDLARTFPERVEVQLAYAEILEQSGRGDALAERLAVEVLEGVLKRRPDEVGVISRLLTIFRERGEKEKSVELMERLPVDDPGAVQVYAAASRSLFDANDAAARARVDERFLLAMEAHGADAGLARAASEYFRTTGRMEEAIGVLEAHGKAAPWSLDLRTRLGVLLLSAKRDEEGVKVLKEVVEVRAGSELALQSLAKFHRMAGDEKEARLYGAELLKVRGGSAREFEVLADEFLAAGEARAARILLEKGVFEHPERVELAMKLAVATRLDPETKGKAGRLFRLAEAAMGDREMDAGFLIESAEVLAEEGNSKAAEERLRSAIRSFPPEKKKETAAALRKLAGIWEREGRNGEAAKALRERAEGLER